MAGYFLLVKTLSRGKGNSVTRAAAYRSGERIRDERSSAVYDHTDRTDVAHAEIVLPGEYAGHVEMQWAQNRQVLWNAVQQSGRNWNARLAREVLVHLPPELTHTQRVALVRHLSHELADRYHSAVDFAVHEPRVHADQRHHHAHLLMTSRQVGPQGLGARTTLELSGRERHERGLGPSKDDLFWLRERWAQVANEALREAGLSVQIDHRSYKDQGIDRESKPHIPREVLYSERNSGRSTPAGDDIRARHLERVEARLKGPKELARVLQRQREEGRQRAILRAKEREVRTIIPRGAMTRDQLNAKRREHRRANAAEINRKQNEWRRAHRDEANRKLREYYHKQKAKREAAKQSLSLQEQPAAAKAGTSAFAEPNPASLERPLPTASAEESVKNWLTYRDHQESLPADKLLDRWLALREGQGRKANAKSPSIGNSEGVADNVDSKSQPGRKHDLEL